MKRFIAVVLLVVLVLSSTSCAMTAVHTEEDVDIPGEIVYMTHTSEQHRISVQIPQFESDTINKRIQSYIAERLRSDYNFEETLTLSAVDIEADIQGDYSDCFVNVDCEITCKTEEVISVIFKVIFNRKGSAHPINGFFSLNFDPTTEERIVFGDRYIVDDALYAVFSEYAYGSLAQKADAQWLNGVDISDLCSKPRFLQGIAKEQDCYTYYTQSGIGIAYPVPHAVGDYQITEIPYAETVGFLR